MNTPLQKILKPFITIGLQIKIPRCPHCECNVSKLYKVGTVRKYKENVFILCNQCPYSLDFEHMYYYHQRVVGHERFRFLTKSDLTSLEWRVLQSLIRQLEKEVADV